jgi:methyltransferase (TIGR00027 family)
MEAGQPSRTAFAAAMYRAVHQLVDRPLLFEDPLALVMLGIEEQALLGHPLTKRPGMRAHIVGRSLLAEQAAAEAFARGVRQYVLLGAGLDTFGYRNPHEGLKVFEVDFPTTQAWKRQRLEQVGIALDGVVHAGIDFERETLGQALERAGFDMAAPGVFAWLGVVPYLTGEAIAATVKAVGALTAGTELIFDYAEPPDRLPAHLVEAVAERHQRLAEMGEPILSTFAPEEIEEKLRDAGFSHVEDLDGEAVNARFFAHSALGLPQGSTAHLIRARV